MLFVPTCSVDVVEIKNELIDAFASVREGILLALRQRVRALNDRLIELYQTAEVEVNKASSTGEEVLALKKLIQKRQAQQERMKDDIQHNREIVDFLVKHLTPISQEVRVLSVVFILYNFI
jgi:molybdopterin converting factor small subunit